MSMLVALSLQQAVYFMLCSKQTPDCQIGQSQLDSSHSLAISDVYLMPEKLEFPFALATPAAACIQNHSVVIGNKMSTELPAAKSGKHAQ